MKPPVILIFVLAFLLIPLSLVLGAQAANRMRIWVHDPLDVEVYDSGYLDDASCSPNFPNAQCSVNFYECLVYGDYTGFVEAYYFDGSYNVRSSEGWKTLWTCCDQDGDNYDCESGPSGGECNGDDCDDGDSNVNPGEVENCANGIDDDCNEYADSDDCFCKPDCGTGPGETDPAGCSDFPCNGTYELVCHYDNLGNAVWENRSDIVAESNCNDGWDNDCDLPLQLTDCADHDDCDGSMGPGDIICCDPADSDAQISSDCINDDCVNESCTAAINQCAYQDRPQCATNECGADGYCNESGGDCRTADEDENVCEVCNMFHWDHQTGGLCCEYSSLLGPSSWCNNFTVPMDQNPHYPDDPPGESCVGNVWNESHCQDLVHNCDEFSAGSPEIDCGHGDGSPDYSSCGPCCEGCNCIDIDLQVSKVATKTMIKNIVEITFSNADPIEDHKVELYLPDESVDKLQTCFGKHCEAWDFSFINSSGEFEQTLITVNIPSLASGLNLANFTFTPSGATPPDIIYEIDIGVRDSGDIECSPIG